MTTTFRGLSVLSALFLLALTSADAAEFVGRVVSVHDGDTVTMLVSKTQVKVQ